MCKIISNQTMQSEELNYERNPELCAVDDCKTAHTACVGHYSDTFGYEYYCVVCNKQLPTDDDGNAIEENN